MQQQRDEITTLYQTHLEAVIGPLVGHSSDGDSRRRRLMSTMSLAECGVRHRPIPQEDGFVFTCEKLIQPDGAYTIKGLADQDYIHVHKKLINHLFHDSRMLLMGDSMIHSNYLILVSELFAFEEHGLNRADVMRNDRQNWASALRVSFEKVINCLEKLHGGEVPNQPADHGSIGTLVFLKIVWYYVEIFCSGKASLLERIRNAGCVTNFLGIWHNWVHLTPDKSLQRNFISRETYIDTLISCHFAVSLITFMADQFPDVPCRLDLTGTDVVETFFSKNGQWVGNRHNYTYARMERNVSHMNRLEEIRVDPLAPDFAKPHPKGEQIWSRQYCGEWQPANLMDYPTPEDTRNAWNEGNIIEKVTYLPVNRTFSLA